MPVVKLRPPPPAMRTAEGVEVLLKLKPGMVREIRVRSGDQYDIDFDPKVVLNPADINKLEEAFQLKAVQD